ncbi:MAG: DUF4167 domain-containing protein [Lutimaribacter sp.]
MRSSKSRSRSKSNRNNNNRSMGNIVNRVFDSSGPEGKVRGTPQQIIEKYNQLARDAQLGNDRVAAENFQQHAEHYLRMLSAAQKDMDARREEQERQNRERQAERDRDRQHRQENTDQPQHEGEASSADMVMGDESDSSDLVETPENRPAAPAEEPLPAAAPETAAEAPEAPAKPKRPRKPRAPRKAADAPKEGAADPAGEKSQAAE